MAQSTGSRSGGDIGDGSSEHGGFFEGLAAGSSARAPTFATASVGGAGASGPAPLSAKDAYALPSHGRVKSVETSHVIGRGRIAPDPRKFKYDRNIAETMPKLSFAASKADRMDAEEAGRLLDRIHTVCGIEREGENVLVAFDKALFFEHAINGASLLQPGRGKLYIGDDASFELQTIKSVMGVDQRRFFRAYADETADVLREVLASYDSFDPAAAEKFGQINQIAVERGLQKYPHLIHDSSDAGLRLSTEERIALVQSKRVVLSATENNVDKLPQLE